MMTQPLPLAGKLPIKTLVARQLPTNVHEVHNNILFAYETNSALCVCAGVYLCTMTSHNHI